MKFSFVLFSFGLLSTLTWCALSIIAKLFEVFGKFDWLLTFLTLWNGFSSFAKWFEVFGKFELLKSSFL